MYYYVSFKPWRAFRFCLNQLPMTEYPTLAQYIELKFENYQKGSNLLKSHSHRPA